MCDKSRVVITGLGVVSPIGIGKEEFWYALIEGKNSIDDIRSFDTSLYRTHKGGEVKNFKPEKYIKKMKLHSSCRSAQLALAASKLAIEDSGFLKIFSPTDRIGVIVGTTTADAKLAEELTLIWRKKGYKNTPSNLAKGLSWSTIRVANVILEEFGFSGLSLVIPTACAAGNYAIGYGFDLLKMNKLDIVIVGGTDPMNQSVFAGFNRFFAIAPDKCQPFDRNRKGLIVSEGAAMLVVETLEHAKKRNAHIYAEILGYGLGCDAYHLTSPHPEGIGGIKAIEMALRNAKIESTDIDYINDHGTGTIANDKIETKIIKRVFGKRAKKIPISSIKSMIGHTMGAASAIEAVTCSLVVKYDIIPPTINYETPDPECDLDYVPNVARKQKVNIALSNAFGFGGNIGILIIGKYNG